MNFLAIDFGAGSGRVLLGSLEEGFLRMEEIHRFANRQVRLGRHVYWDFPALFEDMKVGLRKAGGLGLEIAGIGIDTWGVDFGLIDSSGNLLGNPVSYRDGRTEGLPAKVFEELDPTEHYGVNGTQVMEINSLFQLYSLKAEGSWQLAVADKLLFMPDLFNFFLTGEARNEYTISSTSELLDARARDWDWSTIEQLGLPKRIFGQIVMPGTVIGRLKREIAEETGLGEVEVIAVGSHDTASAVVAVPAGVGEKQVAFLSSGTWSLLGVEISAPILTEEARLAELTNEGGVGGRITFLQNITGLWFMQRLMKEWEERGEPQTYEDILQAASTSTTAAIIAVDAPDFQNPVSMEHAIQAFCRAQGQPPLESKGDVVRCVLQSLAFKYAQAVEKLNKLLPEPIRELHIIGGGCRNGLLNELTSKSLGLPVTTGPVEATGVGNILTQALAKGALANLEEARAVVRWSREAGLLD